MDYRIKAQIGKQDLDVIGSVTFITVLREVSDLLGKLGRCVAKKAFARGQQTLIPGASAGVGADQSPEFDSIR